MRILVILGVIAGSVSLGGTSAHANYCAFYDLYTYNCGFKTLQQCLATISGIGGECVPDPFVRSDSERRHDRRDSRDRDRR